MSRGTLNTPSMRAGDSHACARRVVPVVVVAESSTELTQWVSSRRQHHPSVVAVTAAHDATHGIGTVAGAVLTGLGKRPDLTMVKRNAEHVAAAWLLHGAATDLVLLDAQMSSGLLLPELVEWFCGLGVRPWVVFTTVEEPPHSTTRRVRKAAAEFADQWGVGVSDEVVLREAFPSLDSVPPAPAKPSSGLPLLPRCDGVVFRTMCKRLLPPAEFRKVDRRFVAAVKELRVSVSEAIDESDRQKGRVLARVLRAKLEQARDTEEMVLFARAAQVVVLARGWQMSIDPVLFVAGPPRPVPERRSRRLRSAWATLDQYRDPDFGAAAALHQAGSVRRSFPA
jgi:hypothetical protein